MTDRTSHQESALTVVLALAANALVALAKTVAAVLTGAASMLAEAAHSWADTGNEVFLLVAQRRGSRPADRSHPAGYGREIYIWSLFAAIGLFAVGAGVSITHGIQELVHPAPAENFAVAYLVLGIAFVLEGISFLQAWRQARSAAARRDRDLWEHILSTSDPTVRAVFFEDAAALIGILIAAAGIGAHQLTGSSAPDAIGSILVGVLLAVVALVLIDRNRRFLVGEAADPELQRAAVRALLALPGVARVTQIRLEYVGAGRLFLTGAVDLTGNPAEDQASHALAELEREIARVPGMIGAVLSLSEPEEPALTG
ncbi:cation diffusion facilitator family transporter [Cellulomonas denverensis]|uniref:Cation diffusion facilitator family transporter n=1 Tax=Cellulomonas denverensis TaxID=264297 RepID=A0A7X6QYI1_9CELL|nr:cation diffusion facilitator family transporter [Cellulomonas denverensis]NKY22162.1 cation diffusion facilitator family transporter [Cellulomonas denverensis]GIG27367.1 cation diffusion facilitator transporter [Cellulomonas denverensis]